jgi:thiamine biosynthesis lipoprotein
MPAPARPLALLLLASLTAVAPAAAADGAATRATLVMGTIARITLADGADEAAFDAGFAAFERVDASMSLYRATSDLVRVNAHAGAHAEPVERELFDCLSRSRAMSELTDGAFDVTILPLLRAWGAYPGLDYLAPSRADAVGWEGLLLDPEARTVSFQRRGMGIDLGGVAKGFALDRARDAMVAGGVGTAVLDLGGELLLVGTGPDGGWRIAVRDPKAPDASLGVLVFDRAEAVSTSGNYERDFATEGWRTPSHVFDPRTGGPVRPGLAVTVWAPDATTADGLSTALLVLGPDDAGPVLARVPDVGALFVDDGGGTRRVTLAGRPPRAFEPVRDESRVASIARRNPTP